MSTCHPSSLDHLNCQPQSLFMWSTLSQYAFYILSVQPVCFQAWWAGETAVCISMLIGTQESCLNALQLLPAITSLCSWRVMSKLAIEGHRPCCLGGAVTVCIFVQAGVLNGRTTNYARTRATLQGVITGWLPFCL